MSKKLTLPKIIGHRGAKALAPENTLVSFTTAHSLGAQWVETDVKVSADNVLMLMHDDTLERTTNGHGSVASTSWVQMQGLDAGSWFKNEFTKENIPSLEESVKLFEKLSLGVNLEIKPCPNKTELTARLMAEFVKNKWPVTLPKPLVSSFDMQALDVAKKMDETSYIGILYDNFLPLRWREDGKKLDAYSFHLGNDFVTNKMVEEIKKEGYKVLIYTVNDRKRAEELFAWGVDSIFTDLPWHYE